jgi:DNA-binding transcriptional ArsR family regulator
MRWHTVTDQQQPGWRVGRSIALELDCAVSVFGLPPAEREIPSQAAPVVAAVPDDWQAEWPELMGHRRRWVSTLADMAHLAGVLEEEDYSRATLAMREMTLETALEAIVRSSARLGLEPDRRLPPLEQMVDLTVRSGPATARLLGLEMASEERLTRSMGRETAHAVRLLKGGELHSRFWLWLDRFYFEFYRPWREQQLPAMEARERQAIAALGAVAGGPLPDLGWLPPQNALVSRPAIGEAVRAGQVRLLLWTEPFGFFDYWAYFPGVVIASYSQPSIFMESFRTHAVDVAERVKALADPTRLQILRIIREYAMDNTQMADYLGLARPTVSIHAKLLREAGLIETRQQGRAALHTVDGAELHRLFRDLERFLRLPDEE